MYIAPFLEISLSTWLYIIIPLYLLFVIMKKTKQSFLLRIASKKCIHSFFPTNFGITEINTVDTEVEESACPS